MPSAVRIASSFNTSKSPSPNSFRLRTTSHAVTLFLPESSALSLAAVASRERYDERIFVIVWMGSVFVCVNGAADVTIDSVASRSNSPSIFAKFWPETRSNKLNFAANPLRISQTSRTDTLTSSQT